MRHMRDFYINHATISRLEVTRPSVREQGFNRFPYPVSNILEFEKEQK